MCWNWVMSEILGKMKVLKNHNLIMSLVFVAFGMVVFIWPGVTINLVSKLIGIALIVVGAVGIIQAIRTKENAQVEVLPAIGNAAMAVLGFLIVTNGETMATFIPIIIGVLIFVNGVMNLVKANKMRQKDEGAGRHPVFCH